jgi:uncharacterized protein
VVAVKLLVSLHDVTPFHLPRLLQAERLLADIGVTRVAYLLVPRFHGRHDVARDADFASWCRARRSFDIEWVLHGWQHLEAPGEHAGERWADRLKRRWLTAGEGEFLSLGDEAARLALTAGRSAVLECVGVSPRGFVAPAWLFPSSLLSTLRDEGFEHTEDHRFLYDLPRRLRMRCPVITWATRSRLRLTASLVGNRALFRQWRGVPLLRVAIHPADFTQPAVVDAIRELLELALPRRTATLPGDISCAIQSS